MKTYKTIKIAGLFLTLLIFFSSCTSAEKYAEINKDKVAIQKSGAQLWGENCVRCHSMPSPSAYNDTDWDVIGMHMKVRANLTTIETKKIFDFLKSAN